MSKKKRFVLGLIVLLSAVAFSIPVFGITEEYSGQVLSGESIDLDDFTFTITMDKWGKNIYVDAGTLRQTVPIFSCKKMEQFRICFENTTYDLDEDDLFADVTIYKRKPELTVTKAINETTALYVGQEAKVTITITNTADDASKIELTDDYPTSVEIYDIEGSCGLHESQVYWEGHLGENQTKTCSFLIRGKEEVHRGLAAHIKYWDGVKWVDEYSTSMTLDINPAISLDSIIVSQEFEVEGTTFDLDGTNPGINLFEEFRLILNITNEYHDTITVKSLNVDLPEALEFVGIGHLRFNYDNSTGNRTSTVLSSLPVFRGPGNTVVWSGRMNASASKLLILRIKAKATGNKELIIKTNYVCDHYNLEKTDHENLDIGDPAIGIRMNVDNVNNRFAVPKRLDADENSMDVEALHPYRFTIFVENLNDFADINHVIINVSKDFYNFSEMQYVKIGKGIQKIPYSLVIEPPGVETSTLYKLNVSVTFLNELGKKIFNSTEFEITVKPSTDLTITHKSSGSTTLEGGEETEITTSVNNNRLVDLKDVTVEDTFPEELRMLGVYSRKMKLNKQTDTDVYTYRIKAPIVHKSTTYNITTTVSFFDPDLEKQLNYTKTTPITVTPFKPDLSITVELDEPDEIFPGMFVPIEYTIKNDEATELIRKISVQFPIQEEFDFVGPRTFFIDLLEPGEEFVLEDSLKVIPKIARDSLSLNKTIVHYYDNYGNYFTENSTEDTMEVENITITGPAIFLRTEVTKIINISSTETVKIMVENKGSEAAEAVIEQDDKMWERSLAPGALETIEYQINYADEGNYTIGDAVAKLTYRGIEAYTKGSGAEVQVKLLTQQAEELVEETAAIAEVSPEQVEQVGNLTEEEREELEDIKETKTIKKYATTILIVVLVLIFLFIIVGYIKRKKSSNLFIE